MFQIIGILVLFGMVFGGFTLAGGHFDIIIAAMPFELMMIGGAASAPSSSVTPFRRSPRRLGDFAKLISRAEMGQQDYVDLLALLFQLTKTMKTKGVIALESHIENPHESSIFPPIRRS
jgi:chemotaxis protein MotA